MYKENRIGPRIELWGTPHMSGPDEDIQGQVWRKPLESRTSDDRQFCSLINMISNIKL